MSSPNIVSKIIGTGSAFPSHRLSNDELSKFVDTNHAWIVERTGIHERRIATASDPEERHVALAKRASQKALELAQITAEEVDLIVYATATPQGSVPSHACRLQNELGVEKGFAFDVNAACSGFLFALNVADNFIRSGTAKTALVVGCEILSSILDWKDRSTCVIFGDGAGAVLLKAKSDQTQEASQLLSFDLRSEGQYSHLIETPLKFVEQDRDPAGAGKLVAEKVHMKGSEVFKLAARAMVDRAEKVLNQNQKEIKDITWVVPHQANFRIVQSLADHLHLSMDKILTNIQHFGNTSSASIPIMLDEANRKGCFKEGDLLLMLAFGAGTTSAACLARW